jgi:hypothetical protein
VAIFPKMLADGPEKTMNALHRKKEEKEISHENTRKDTKEDKGD